MGRFKYVSLLTLVVLLTASLLCAATQKVPRIFTSDLESGPNGGGQNNMGAWVTIHGSGFGASQGTSTVTLGGVPVYRYALWSDSRIIFQLGNTVGSGDLVVSVANAKSNPIPFTVRAGSIFFVSPGGNDSWKGSFVKPWKTFTKALNAMQPGDIVYAMDGATAATLNIARTGVSGKPLAIVAYPGANVTIGSATGQRNGVTAPQGGYSYWVLAGLNLRGAIQAVDATGVIDWRLVGNDISCPNGYGTAACVRISSSKDIEFLANIVHDSGSTSNSDAANYASVQLLASNVEVGWNEIGNTRSCRALTLGADTSQYALRIHDNYIHDAVCDGISFAGIDASQGAVQAYNNIVQRTGTGPAPGGVEQSYTCINVSGNGSVPAQILNNTLYDCGARGYADAGAIAASAPVIASNNIVALQSGQQYVTPNTTTSKISGANNILWGGGFIPGSLTNSLNLDPQFIDVGQANFKLQPSSPAIDAGANTGVTTDYAGAVRPQGRAIDIGAYEFTGTATTNAQLAVTPSQVTFGTLTTGTTSSQTVTVTNGGNAAATISQISVTGSGFTTSGLILPATVAAGQSASFTVTFAPQTTGTATGSVTIVSDAVNGTNTVQLSGSGVAPATTLTASPTSLNFGSVTTGASASQTVTLTAGSGSVTISQATVTGNGFSISGLTTPVTIAAGQSASFQVKFAPTTVGTANGSVSFVSNSSNSPAVISLTGTGATATGTLALSSSTLSFGNVTTGTSSTKNLTVTASSANVTISQATVTGAGMSVTGPTLPLTLVAGQSATFAVRFAPQSAGTSSGTLSIVSNASNSPSNVAVSGTGVTVGTLAANPSSLNFGTVSVGSSSSQSVTVTANTASVTVSQANVSGVGFTVSGPTLPVTLAAGQSATFTVRFAPTTAGTASGAVSVVSNSSNSPVVISLTGTATDVVVPAQVAYVQGAYATPQTAQTTVTANYAAAQGAGDLNVVVVGWNDATAQVTSVTDTRGNVYTLAVGPTVYPGTATQSIYYAKNIAAATAGANTVTVKFNSAAQYVDLRIAEYSGIDTTNPVDVAIGATGNSTTSSSGAVTTTNANDLIVGANLVSTLTTGPGTGYTQRLLTTPDGDILEDRFVTATGSYTATAPVSPAGPWIMQLVAFRAAGSGTPTAATPTFSPAGGAYSSPQTVTISDATPGATIYYTTNGTTPTTSSPVYSGPITVSLTTTLKAIAVASGYTNSAVATATYTIQPTAATPTFSLAGGTYLSPQTVTISDATPAATIYYTTNGTTPTTASLVYSGPITVSVTTSLKAIAVASGYTNSTVATGTYTIMSSVPSQRSAALSWTASTSSGVVGYNVYRSTQSGTAYTKLNSTPISGTTYQDTTVAAGTTYYYVTTAVAGTGTESTYSNQASAIIPTP